MIAEGMISFFAEYASLMHFVAITIGKPQAKVPVIVKRKSATRAVRKIFKAKIKI